MNRFIFIYSIALLTCNNGISQERFLGADLSYVNEMEDCGVVYLEDHQPADVYDIFSGHGANIARFRLWHTPAWYDQLNQGKRYSNLEDVRKSIARARDAGMAILLDFHLSDTWADPGNQLIPQAWLHAVDDLDVLSDSLYLYIYNTLTSLHNEGLLPEMVQIGNETNKGILLSPGDNSTWTLDWDRNAALFNSAIQAVRDVENSTTRNIRVMIHIAGPANASWLLDGFTQNGVTDFDLIGLSYYWAWHMPTDIAATGDIIKSLKTKFPGKDVMIVETGYPWTMEWNDDANNIISETHPDYHPASPQHQRDFLVDLTQEVFASGGIGVIYWEPAWVSSDCYTLWGQGSHQEHAAFFDFNNNLLIPGGAEWLNWNYNTDAVSSGIESFNVRLYRDWSDNIAFEIEEPVSALTFRLINPTGIVVKHQPLQGKTTSIDTAELPAAVYHLVIYRSGVPVYSVSLPVIH